MPPRCSRHSEAVAGLALLWVASWLRPVAGLLVGAAVLPHGDFAYDPALVNGTGGSVELHRASLEVGKLVAGLTPDVIFLTTPHGLELSEDYLVYLNEREAGVAPLDDVPHSFGPQGVPMNLSTDAAAAAGLLEVLKAAKLPATGLRGFSDVQPLPISWGEILPLTFVAAARQGTLPKVVVLSMPLRRFNYSVEMVPELLRLGSAVARYFERLPQRAFWLVSADLAHTHLASGPYGFCPCAQPYDDAVGHWAAGAGCGPAADRLLTDAAEFQRQGAASCGFTGLVALHGAMEAVRQWEAEGSREEELCRAWAGRVLANRHPTYYGMMAAALTRRALAPPERAVPAGLARPSELAALV